MLGSHHPQQQRASTSCDAGSGVPDRPAGGGARGGSVTDPLSRGKPNGLSNALRSTGNPVLDATCPNVAHIHKLVAEAERKRACSGHYRCPQPPGGVGYCGVVRSACCAGRCGISTKMAGRRPFQTRKNHLLSSPKPPLQGKFGKILRRISQKKCVQTLKIFDTICNATFCRQSEAVKNSRPKMRRNGGHWRPRKLQYQALGGAVPGALSDRFVG